MNDSKNLSQKQIGAIKKSLEIGRRLTQEHPEIAKLYKCGYSQPEIVSYLDLAKKYHTTNVIARVSVSHALRGYDGHLEQILDDQYNGLLDDNELDLLLQEHNSAGGSKGGKASLQKRRNDKSGIHGLSSKQLKDNGIKGGQKCYDEKIGIHSLSRKERQSNSKKGTIALGFVNWTDKENAYLKSLVSDEKYQYHKGRHFGKPNYPKITQELNQVFHEGKIVRTENSVRRAAYLKKLQNTKLRTN